MDERPLPHELDSRPQARREWSGWLRSVVLPIGLVMAIVGVLLVLQDRGTATDNRGAFGTVDLPPEKNGTGRPPAASPGRMAPDFVLQSITGDTVRLSDLRGRPVLVNFWATWCSSCRTAIPVLIQAFEAQREPGLTVISIDLRESESRASAFARDFGIPFPVLLDLTGEVAVTWQIGGPDQDLPSSYFLDSGGVVKKVVRGNLTAASIQEGLALILEAAP